MGLIHTRLVLSLTLAGLLEPACRPEPEASIRGRVLDLFERPVQATLSVRGMARQVASDRNGEYLLPYVPGQFEVRIEAPGHLPETVPWHVYEDARIDAAPVHLIPVPEGPGLWRVDTAGYARVPVQRIRALEQSVLGLSSAAHQSVVVTGVATPWCLETPLVYAASDTADGEPFTGWALEAGGTLWQEGAAGGRPRALEQTMHGESIWTVTVQTPGLVALVPTNSAGRQDQAYYLDARRCGEGA